MNAKTKKESLTTMHNPFRITLAVLKSGRHPDTGECLTDEDKAYIDSEKLRLAPIHQKQALEIQGQHLELVQIFKGISETVSEAFGQQNSKISLGFDEFKGISETVSEAFGQQNSKISLGFDEIFKGVRNQFSNVSKAIRTTYEPVRFFMVAVDLHEALKDGNVLEAEKIMGTPDFGVELLMQMVKFSGMNEAEIVEEVKLKLSDSEQALEKINNGAKSRQDQIDKELLIDYFEKKNHTVKNREEIEQWPFKDWPISANYSLQFYVNCYKTAMPNVKLMNGRPKKK